MVPASTNKIKELRELTGAGILDCKKALEEAKGEIEAAVEVLRKRGLARLKERTGKTTDEGLIDSYIHAGGRIGVIVEANCETDFVAQNKEFKEFVHNIALHIAAARPLYISREDVGEKTIDKEKEFYKAQAKNEDKPKKAIPKIVEGKLDKFFSEQCLLEQPFVKNPEITIEEYMGELVSKLGENLVISRFIRYQIGDTESSQ